MPSPRLTSGQACFALLRRDDVEFNAVGQNIIGSVGDVTQTQVGTATAAATGRLCGCSVGLSDTKDFSIAAVQRSRERLGLLAREPHRAWVLRGSGLFLFSALPSGGREGAGGGSGRGREIMDPGGLGDLSVAHVEQFLHTRTLMLMIDEAECMYFDMERRVLILRDLD